MKIAIIGKMCSGKSTLAGIIENYDSGYRTFSFGDNVKKYAKELFNMKGKDRSLLISFANKMREIDPGVWIRPVIEESRLFDRCIIDDVRYQDELDALVRDNWIIIKLSISNELQEKRITLTYPKNYQDHLDNRDHYSENVVFQFTPGYPHLSIVVDEHDTESMRDLIISFLERNIF
tara:strand:- start:4481 stop:5011 length:531 start_codon:yes stop_codon:yes gene_type:complete